MLALVAAHLVIAGLLPLLSARSHRAAFLAAAVLPAATLVWALGHAPEALRGGVTRTTEWAPELGLALSFRLDALALVMVVLVAGLGALILAYSAWYFGPGDSHSGSSQPPARPRCCWRSPGRCSGWCSPTICSLCTCSGRSPRSRRSC